MTAIASNATAVALIMDELLFCMINSLSLFILALSLSVAAMILHLQLTVPISLFLIAWISDPLMALF